MDSLRTFSTRETPQSEALRPDQVENNAGGYAWAVDNWTRLNRFLILGAQDGTYYIGEHELVKENAGAVLACLQEDGLRTVATIVDVSDKGRAAKNDPALFALALASKHGDLETRRAAYAALPKVARIGTHLFHLAAYREQFGGWSRGLRNAVARWYLDRDPSSLAYQLVKYRQRDGWSHRDLLRLSHPKTASPDHRALFDFACDREATGVPEVVEGFGLAQASPSATRTAKLVREYGLPREAIQTDHLKSPEVWEALLGDGMPVGAMLRNLANMTRVGLLKPMSEAEGKIASALTNEKALAKARVHPVAVLSAAVVYAQGHSALGRGEDWIPSAAIVDALNEAFYLSFGGVTSANKRTLIGLDVSGSMSSGLGGVAGLTCRDGAAAMALITAATEPQTHTMAFAGPPGGGWRNETHVLPLPLSGRERLDDVIRNMSGIPFGRTDCALPMLYAMQEGIEADTFVIYTDNETWAGNVHPAQALRGYREKMGINARLVTVGMTSSGFTIADPQDAGMLDVVGFDTATPNVLSAFSRGEV